MSAFEQLAALEGIWRGTGAGDYPTIDGFRYDETLRIEADASYPILHYEQRTWLIPSGEPSHWESGFIRPTEDGRVEMSNSQTGDRVEVLRGDLTVSGDRSVLTLDSVVLAHDPRLVRTQRTINLSGDRLDYVVRMATHTTPAPELLQHLRAGLTRQ